MPATPGASTQLLGEDVAESRALRLPCTEQICSLLERLTPSLPFYCVISCTAYKSLQICECRGNGTSVSCCLQGFAFLFFQGHRETCEPQQCSPGPELSEDLGMHKLLLAEVGNPR